MLIFFLLSIHCTAELLLSEYQLPPPGQTTLELTPHYTSFRDWDAWGINGMAAYAFGPRWSLYAKHGELFRSNVTHPSWEIQSIGSALGVASFLARDPWTWVFHLEYQLGYETTIGLQGEWHFFKESFLSFGGGASYSEDRSWVNRFLDSKASLPSQIYPLFTRLHLEKSQFYFETEGYLFSDLIRLKASLGHLSGNSSTSNYSLWIEKTTLEDLSFITVGASFSFSLKSNENRDQNSSKDKMVEETSSFISKILKIHDRLNLVKIDKGSQDGVKIGDRLRLETSAGDTIAFARVIGTRLTDAALEVTDFLKEVPIDKSFIVTRGVSEK